MNPRQMSEDELASLSDDEILGMEQAPEMAPAPLVEQDQATGDLNDAVADADQVDNNVAEADGDKDGSGEDISSDTATDDTGSSNEESGGNTNPLEEPDEPESKAEKPASESDTAKAKTEEPKAEDDKGSDVAKANATEKDAAAIDYEAAYKKIMAPFKAAGKMINLESPDEAVQLMQMGAHYTKKMQALQPNLKLLRMLENNDLLDPAKLSFLIDVSRKNPEAVKKLVKDSGIDPLDIDTTTEPAYKPGNHTVSDETMRFTSTLEEVTSEPEGKNLVVAINKTWDGAAKERLWTDPSILKVLAQQKASGIYDKISNEIDRRKTLGGLQNQDFLTAYELVGKEMDAKGLLTPVSSNPAPAAAVTSSTPPEARKVVETRPAARKTISNNDRAKAASPSRGAPVKAVVADFNPLALSDEEFEKTSALGMKL